VPEQLSEKDAEPNSCRAAAGCPTAHSYSTASSRGPEVSCSETAERFGLRLDVYSPSQVLQTNGCFYHSPLPPCVSEKMQTAGPLRSTDVTPLHRYYEPIRHPLVFHRFPGFASYTVCCSADFSSGREGFSSCLAHPCHRAAANTPPECLTASVSCGNPCCLRPFGAGSAPGVFGFRGHLCVHFRCGPMTRSPSQDGFVDRLHSLRLLHECDPSYRVLTLALVGLPPTEYASLKLDTHR